MSFRTLLSILKAFDFQYCWTIFTSFTAPFQIQNCIYFQIFRFITHSFNFWPTVVWHLQHHQLNDLFTVKDFPEKKYTAYMISFDPDFYITLNSSKSTLRSPLLSRLLNIFSMFSSHMSLVILLRYRIISPSDKLLLPSVSICLNNRVFQKKTLFQESSKVQPIKH